MYANINSVRNVFEKMKNIENQDMLCIAEIDLDPYFPCKRLLILGYRQPCCLDSRIDGFILCKSFTQKLCEERDGALKN